jgi:hypothetical protein
VPRKTHFDRLFERKGITRSARDKGNAELARQQAEREQLARKLAHNAIQKAKAE